MRPPPPLLPAGDEVLSSSRAVPRYPAHCAVCLGISVEKKFKSYSEKAQEWGPVCLGCWVGRERGLPSVPHLIPSSKETRDSEHKGGGRQEAGGENPPRGRASLQAGQKRAKLSFL